MTLSGRIVKTFMKTLFKPELVLLAGIKDKCYDKY